MPLIDMSETYQMTNVGDHIDGTDVYQSNRNLLDNAYFVGGVRGRAFSCKPKSADELYIGRFCI